MSTRYPNGLKVDKDELFIADVAVTTTAAELNVLDGVSVTTAQLNAAALFVDHYQVEDLDAGGDITARPVFAVPTGHTITLTSIDIIPQGDDAGIDASNTSVVTVSNGANAIVAKTYDGTTGKVFPDAGVVGNLGSLSATHKVLAAGAVVKLTIANGTTANTPAFLVRLTGTVSV